MRKSRPQAIPLETITIAYEKSLLSDADLASRVQDFSKKAKGTRLSDAAVSVLADILRSALQTPTWRDEFAEQRKNNKEVLHLKRIAEALRTLQCALPNYIEYMRPCPDGNKLILGLRLYNVVNEHQFLIDAVEPQGKGRPPSLERDLTTFLSSTYLKVVDGESNKGVANAFAAEAVNWLKEDSKKAGDETVARAGRRRKTQKNR